MSKIFISGSEGFIGSHLVELLLKRNYKIKAFCLYNSFNSCGWLETINPKLKRKLEIGFGDLRDISTIEEHIKDCTSVIHLGALVAIPYSYIAANSYIDINVRGTLNLIESAKKNGIKKLTHISTSEVYGSAQFLPISEKHPINPQSPYAASKAAGEHIVSAFNKSYNLPISIVRPFNTFGPRQSLRAIIPSIILQILKKSKVEIGSIYPKRDFTYVDDTVKGIINVHESSKTVGKVINLGSNFSISIKDLVEICEKILGRKKKIIISKHRIRPTRSEVDHLLCDPNLAKRLIGWKSTCRDISGLEKCLRKFVVWLKNGKNLEYYGDSSKFVL